ncbi:hypothetical protein K5713_00950 [Trueperella pyogenes]|uniref:hypothetical protein n=1 Tax=Trueperella pyogenes TaxID=1661 RepID=UPI0021679D5A|nr:hypothetical protein [Trueperella pyogenes]UVJ53922.1 hypothetical protein K5713_00950 [Trueperella pyogenes]
MKKPNPEFLTTLSKAPVNDPIIAGTASTASTASIVNKDARTKLTIRLDNNLHGRIRAAFLADLTAGSGITSLSAWATHHLEQAVLETEQRLNDGEQFTAVKAGVVPNFRIV